MSTSKTSVTVTCDRCGTSLVTARTTTAGARGDAARLGWATSRIYSHAASADSERPDLCPACNPNYRPPAQPSEPDAEGTPLFVVDEGEGDER